MATVCGGSLALMDAGVPLKAPCAGIAMGLVVGEDHKYSISRTSPGAEDHYGDMDFKVAGTRSGITALQMDIKVLGISIQMMREASPRRKRPVSNPRHHGTDPERGAPADFRLRSAPLQLKIPQDKIRDLIGPGGKKIRSIIEAPVSKLTFLKTAPCTSFPPAEPAAMRPCRWSATSPPAPNRQDLSRQSRSSRGVRRLRRAFPGTDGLLHISEISEHASATSRRAETRRPGPRQGPLHRGQQSSLVSQALIKEAREKQQKAAAGGEAPPPRPKAAPAAIPATRINFQPPLLAACVGRTSVRPSFF